MALANPVELLSQRELGKCIEEFVPLDPGRSRAWTASLWDFLYDRKLQERCGGAASGRGFESICMYVCMCVCSVVCEYFIPHMCMLYIVIVYFMNIC